MKVCYIDFSFYLLKIQFCQTWQSNVIFPFLYRVKLKFFDTHNVPKCV